MNEFRGMRVINDEIKMVEKIKIEKLSFYFQARLGQYFIDDTQ